MCVFLKHISDVLDDDRPLDQATFEILTFCLVHMIVVNVRARNIPTSLWYNNFIINKASTVRVFYQLYSLCVDSQTFSKELLIAVILSALSEETFDICL